MESVPMISSIWVHEIYRNVTLRNMSRSQVSQQRQNSNDGNNNIQGPFQTRCQHVKLEEHLGIVHVLKGHIFTYIYLY